MSDKRIEDWIHGRLVIETDERDIIIRVEPVEGGPTPTGEVIRLRPTAAQVMHMRGDGEPVGPKKLALELGLRRALQIGRIVGGTALFSTAGLLIKGVPWTVALPAAAVMAAGSALAGGVIKTNKEIGKQGDASAVSNWKILGGIIIEVLKLIRELLSKEKKK